MQEINMKYFAILVLLLGMYINTNAGKIYKWVDENGQIHYSSQKPPGQETETVKVSKGPKVTATETTETDNDENNAQAEQDAAADAQARAQLAKADAASKKRLCEQARKNLASLNATVRVTKIDEKTGEAVRMNDDQRLEAMKSAQQNIKEYCQ